MISVRKMNEKPRGFVLCWNMKNLLTPERIFPVDDALTAIAFGRTRHNVLAVGTARGKVLGFNVTQPSLQKPIFDADTKLQSQTEKKATAEPQTSKSFLGFNLCWYLAIFNREFQRFVSSTKFTNIVN